MRKIISLLLILLLATSICSSAGALGSPTVFGSWVLPWGNSVELDFIDGYDGVTGANHGAYNGLAFDFATKEKNVVLYAPAAGTAMKLHETGGYGNYVKMITDDGFVVIMAHMESIYKDITPSGVWVEQGHPLGILGSEGRSSGPHVHFEIQNLDGSKLRPPENTKMFGKYTLSNFKDENYNEKNPLKFSGGVGAEKSNAGGKNIIDQAKRALETIRRGVGPVEVYASELRPVEIIYAYAENPTALAGDNISIRVLTSDMVDRVQLLNEYDEEVGKRNEWDTYEGGEKTWSLRWKARGSQNRKLKVRAHGINEGEYDDVVIEVVVVGYVSKAEKEAQAAELAKQQTAQNSMVNPGWMPPGWGEGASVFLAPGYDEKGNPTITAYDMPEPGSGHYYNSNTPQVAGGSNGSQVNPTPIQNTSQAAVSFHAGFMGTSHEDRIEVYKMWDENGNAVLDEHGNVIWGPISPSLQKQGLPYIFVRDKDGKFVKDKNGEYVTVENTYWKDK